MNYKMVGRFIAQILTIETLFMIPAFIISLAFNETNAIRGFLYALFILVSADIVLFQLCRGAPSAFYAKEGFVCVSLGWIALSIAGCLPFWLSGEIPSFIDAMFEIVSGFTTTGASILTDVEAMSKGNLYWRSFSHWLGGMGVLVFLLAFSSTSEKGKGFTMHLLRAESPGPNITKIVPRMKKTAAILYLLYIILTIINFLFLIAGKMPVFDALCTTFGTAGTGGFGIRNDSMASYSPYLQNVTTVFMLLFGVNFSCYYLLILREFRAVFKDEELRLYICIVVASIALICWNILGSFATQEETLRHAAFQVASIITTTGYATTDFDLWPSFSKSILLCLMVVGACAGSTGGGLKCGRLLLLLKNLFRNMKQLVHPRRVIVVKNNGQPISEKVMDNTNAYLSAYVVLIILSFLLISLDGYSIETNVSAVVSCFNNIGPGFDTVGPTCNFSSFSPRATVILTFDMLAGRLEIFPVLLLFSRNTWRRR